MRQPVCYLPHGGGPCFFMDDPYNIWTNMGDFLHKFPKTLPKKPDAIVVIAAHWESDPIKIHHHPNPSLYYDYYDFPEHTYQLQYPASGYPLLAEQIHTLLTEQHIQSEFEEKRGWDHSVFIPLKVMFPDADIPIVEISLHNNLDPAYHFNIGRALYPLRNKNILIMGSGMSYHNLPFLFSGQGTREAYAFDNWLTDVISLPACDDRDRLLIEWEKTADAHSAHPRTEHLLPLMAVSGAARQDHGKCIFKDIILHKPISAYQFG
ncbi:DODA-type extradiol aromatic ring-opening family dioxygenase [Commensalibacter melissae]|uniref:DODA-type extradiol aromatic ring-opening family dioxygenase n=1 Tax=Commensalibacter melissae TaxID=2070537 RepID=UPI000EFA5E74|nr:class III extradiol ring-cleavage dioxygenase [Commensalibacter melissae]AYN87361.1 dioxygenase [Commensalibacter melissae]